ncbi:MAG: hypothetical protein H0X40_13510 [Chthoniobacterales bacterium]|nr:hypothetical protein [Chthoniobacterales bacterium]
MEPDLFRFDDPHGFQRKRTNYFAWTILILFLIGLVFAVWLGSFYVLGQPERPESYRILKKLHKIETPKRFALTAAPAGEYLNPKQLYARYSAMGPAELARKNAELARNFIRNFQQVHGLVTYVVGRFNIMGARELTPDDTFDAGAVALARAVDQPELLLEHIFTTADTHDAELLTPRLAMGLDMNFERSHDLSAVIHAERLADGRIQITAIPLLYGSYAVTKGTGTFSLQPPTDLNLEAGWPVVKTADRHVAEVRYDGYREKLAPVSASLPIVGLPVAKTAAPSENALVRVESAVALGNESASSKLAANSGNHRLDVVPNDKTTTLVMAKPSPPPRLAKAAEASPSPNEIAVAAAASPSPTHQVLRALPLDSSNSAVAISSTTGATWKTFSPGQMPVGRLVDQGGLREVANNGLRGERVYLRGQFVVNFADGNRAVLRTTNGHGGSRPASFAHNARVIVDYPAGVSLPQPGSTLDRDSARPFEVTEVREQSDGQLNVFVREIMKQ